VRRRRDRGEEKEKLEAVREERGDPPTWDLGFLYL